MEINPQPESSPMTRQTSAEAYRKIKEDGLLSLRKWQVYDILYRFGPLTSTEVIQKYREIYGPIAESGGMTTRCAELVHVGAAQEVGEKKNNQTGMMNILFDVTNQIPIKLEKPKKIPCKHCHGKGYFQEQQIKLF
jgi:hypothetical protein